jgi:hypothetical protein
MVVLFRAVLFRAVWMLLNGNVPVPLLVASRKDGQAGVVHSSPSSQPNTMQPT